MDGRKYALRTLPLGRAWARRSQVSWSPPRGAVQRLTLNVRTAGSGPPLLLLHGLGGSHRYWGAAYDALASDHRLIVPDLLGFGDSPASPDGYGADRHCQALLALLDDLAVGGPVLVAGHSVGALIGLRLAALRPDRCVGVVALAPPLFNSPAELRSHFESLGWAERAVAFEREPAASALDWAAEAGPLGTGAAVLFRVDLPAPLAADGVRGRPGAYRETMRAVLMTGQAVDWLAACRVPVLLAAGDQDRLVDPPRLKELARRHSHVRVEVVPSADHHLPLVAPAACVELIRSFP